MEMTKLFREEHRGSSPARRQDKFPVKIVVKMALFYAVYDDLTKKLREGKQKSRENFRKNSLLTCCKLLDRLRFDPLTHAKNLTKIGFVAMSTPEIDVISL